GRARGGRTDHRRLDAVPRAARGRSDAALHRRAASRGRRRGGGPGTRWRPPDEGGVAVAGSVASGAYVRRAGEDVRAGDVVVQPGGSIGAAEVGLLATLGYSQGRVFRRPRVAILSTGNELADLGTEPGPGQIPNTNTYSLMAQV